VVVPVEPEYVCDVIKYIVLNGGGNKQFPLKILYAFLLGPYISGTP
jgi:hypothetical protein